MPVSAAAARRLAADLLAPGRCFAAGAALRLRHRAAEERPWELFQGRLLDETQTRQKGIFESWSLCLVAPEGEVPLLALLLDAGALFLVRHLEGYVWEGYSEGNVARSRERRRHLCELVARFDLAARADAVTLAEELRLALTRAVTGSPLPLTPPEAPHPLFSVGRWFLCPRADDAAAPADSADELLGRFLAPAHAAGEAGRVVEAWLRALPDAAAPPAAPPAAPLARQAAAAGMTPDDLLAVLRRVFLDVSLSPWTGFARRTLDVLTGLEEGGIVPPEQTIDFLGWLLRLLGRHLTAYDLVTFHHRGANYPDALLLDLVLGEYLVRLERHPERFAGATGRLRRRALRQAYVVRRRYEGHLVPDVPTSPGEYQRVYRGGPPRPPEEQILQPLRRRRRLYDETPLLLGPAARAALAASLADLDHPAERLELGAALFLDRPFGGGKGPVEPDATPLLCSLACSRFIAERRLRQLAADVGGGAAVEGLELPGLSLDAIGPPVRPGTVSLADAARAGPDFVFRHTLPGSLAALARRIDLRPVAWLTSDRVLLARSPRGPGLTVYDHEWRPRLELEPCLQAGYVLRGGVEVPAAGLRATHPDGRTVDLPVKDAGP